MINQFIFSVCSHVQIQGDEALQVVYMDSEVAAYKVIGFEDHPVIIEDYRSFGLAGLNTFLMDGRSSEFKATFNRPSNVLFFKGDNKDVLIQLMETTQKDPPYMLWIATGTGEDTIPTSYSYLFRDTSRYTDNKQVFLSLHKQPPRRSILVERPVPANLVMEPQMLSLDTLRQ
jgi:hypothetical protein